MLPSTHHYALVLGLFSAAAACSSNDVSTDVAQNASALGGLPCEVDAVLARSCRSCHGTVTQYGAPMPLVSYRDLVAPSKSNPEKRVIDLVSERTRDVHRPMPPPPNVGLGQNDFYALDAWIAAGTPRVDATCATTPQPTLAEAKLSCTPNEKVRPRAKFAMPKSLSDEIVCYGFDIAHDTKHHVVGLAPVIDNTRIVHHLILFEANETVDPNMVPCGQGSASNWRFIAGWAPGGGPFDLPPEAGLPQEGTSHYVMQIHYNNQAALEGQEDGSGFDLCSTSELRANDAGIMTTGTLAVDLAPRSVTELSCDYTWNEQDVHVYGSSPHMHRLGRNLAIDLVSGGNTSSILNQPNFNFDVGGAVSVNATIKKGDVLRTTCGWNNTTDFNVRFGEKTSNEMCFGFMTYYPRVVTPSWHFAAPALFSKCSPKK